MKTWSPENHECAALDGWILNCDLDPEFYMVGIERVDDPQAWNPPLPFDQPRFANDDDAVVHVLALALAGDTLALHALECLEQSDLHHLHGRTT